MTEPRLSVIIPARDAAATLPATLAGLAEQCGAPSFEVVLVDDGSVDGTGEIAAASEVVTRVVRTGGSGPALARNAGAAAAAAQRLAFLDADCRPTPGWLASGDAALNSAELVIGETRPDPDQPIGPFDRTLSVTGRSPLFESANLFVRRELFERLDGFEHWLGPQNGIELGEDVWFGWSAVRAGAQVVACPEALVHHAVFPRSALGFAAERWRLRFFPAMARRMPELRTEMFYRRYFLTERQAQFDAALLSLVLSLLTARRLPAVGAIPYAWQLGRDLREPHGPVKLVGRMVADAVGFAGLIVGSARYRTLVL